MCIVLILAAKWVKTTLLTMNYVKSVSSKQKIRFSLWALWFHGPQGTRGSRVGGEFSRENVAQHQVSVTLHLTHTR